MQSPQVLVFDDDRQIRELLARHLQQKAADQCAHTVIDSGGDDIELTDTGCDPLLVVLDRPACGLSWDRSLDRVHGCDEDGLGRLIDVRISRLRRKLPRGGTTQIMFSTAVSGSQVNRSWRREVSDR